jgi:CBS domain containing-hemolysin-like protein
VSPTTTLWVMGISLLVACVAAVGAKALREFSRQKLEIVCRRRNARHLLTEILLHYQRAALGVETLQVVATAVLVCASSYWVLGNSLPAGADVEIVRPGLSTILTAAALGGLLLLAVEIWLPQAIANLWAEGFLVYTWHVWRTVAAALSPLVWAAGFVDTLFHRLAGRPQDKSSEGSFEEEIRTIVTEGHREGLLQEDAREMIEGVIELGDAVVSEIMTPRTDIFSTPLPETLEDAVKYIARVAHTRVPVYGKNRDDIIGILHAKDLLSELAKPKAEDREPVKKILREPYFVPETKRVDDLLGEFQLTRNHMAIVLDEYGGVSGLVTIEDVLEEIVGEIADEYDEAVVEGIKRIDDKTAEVLARVHVDEVNERLGITIPEEGEFDTVGGFVFHELGRIPTVGEQLLWQNIRVTVLDATRRRIDRVKIEVLTDAEVETSSRPPPLPA